MYGFSLPLWYQYKLLQNTKYNHHSCTVSVPLRLKLRRRIVFYGGGDHLECIVNTKKDENVISGIALISYAQSQKIEKPNNLKVCKSKKAKDAKQLSTETGRLSQI